MHELSLASSIIEYLEHLAKEQGLRRVDAVFLEVGEMTHIDPRQLRGALKMISEGTVAEKSRVYIRRRRIALSCSACGKESGLEVCDTISDYRLICPLCGSADVRLSRGRELLLKRVRGVRA